MLVLAIEFSRCASTRAGAVASRPEDATTPQPAGPRCDRTFKTEQRKDTRLPVVTAVRPKPANGSDSRKAPVAQCINWVTDSDLADAFGPRAECQLLRKEVIQPHLPVRLPCYDFTPIAGPTFDSSLLAVGPLASGVTNFRGVTGGVYKARERIHPGVADPGLLATPTSRSRVADSDPN